MELVIFDPESFRNSISCLWVVNKEAFFMIIEVDDDSFVLFRHVYFRKP